MLKLASTTPKVHATEHHNVVIAKKLLKLWLRPCCQAIVGFSAMQSLVGAEEVLGNELLYPTSMAFLITLCGDDNVLHTKNH